MAQDMYAESLRHFLKPVRHFLDDEKVSEIMINGPTEIWIEKGGKVFRTEAEFTHESIEAAARNMAQFVGRRLTDENPRLDARLPDGSRIHVVMPPIARKGCTIAIRKFFKDKLTVQSLVDFGSMTPEMARLIDACVALKENILVSGGTGSGKTTLLNCVATFIPADDRILTIEDSAELQLNQEHIVPFESRPADKFGKGEVNMGDLLQSALRLRPDRIVVGEVRGGEAFHLMQAMNTGHGGSLATVHANTPTDTLRRVESLCLQSGIDLPMVAVRAQVASALNVIICCARLQDGSRKTTHISEVLPLDEKGDYRTQDLFVFTQTHKDEDGKIHGYHAPTGLLPTFMGHMAAFGFSDLDAEYFDPETWGVEPPPIFVNQGYEPSWAPSLFHRTDGGPEPDDRPKADGKRKREIVVRVPDFGEPKEEAPPPPKKKKAKADDDEDELDALASELDSLGESDAPPPPGDDEGTDPGADESTSMASVPGDNVGVTLEEGDPTASVDLPDDDELSEEEAAIAAALEADQPSIQLSDDFAEDVKAAEKPAPRARAKGRVRKRGGAVGKK